MIKEPKDDQMLIRVNMAERVKIVDAAMERDRTLSQFVRDAVDFYVAFPVAMIEQLKKATADIKMDIYDIIPRLLLVYVAMDAAIVKNFGISKTFERAFGFGPDGKLLEGSELSDKTFEEVDTVCKEVLKKMKWMAEGRQDKKVLLSKEEGAYVRVLQEARYAMVAKAKGK
jgi:hypothetical protein